MSMNYMLNATFNFVNRLVCPRGVYLLDTPAMHDDYTRLMAAAEEMKRWSTPTDLAVGLTSAGYTTSTQTVINWRSRGVAKPALVPIAKILGCRASWIEDGGGICATAVTGYYIAAQQRKKVLPGSIWSRRNCPGCRVAQ